jgi:DNA polymerase-1
MACSSLEAIHLLRDGSLALAVMEGNGIRLDMPYLDRSILEVQAKIVEGEKDRTNIGSGEQLAHVIYKCLGYPCTSLTATGKPKADEEALRKVDLPFVKEYFARKKLEKVLSTYLLGFKREQIDGFLHPSFNFNPESFRSGANDPNVQNIPSRGPMTKLIRDCVIPRCDHYLVEIDYAQIEVRVAACYHKDPRMLEYIRDPSTDMHRDVAMELFLIPQALVEKKTTRDWTKNRFVFPQFYGQVYFDCAYNIWKAVEREENKLPNGTSVRQHLRDNGITGLGECDPKQRALPGTFERHVKDVEDRFWLDRFPKYTEWKKRWWREYSRNGGYRMLTGFYVNGLYKKNEVLNYAIQGSSFHCLLWSIIEIQRHLRKYKWKTKLINQIHDCLVADVPIDELQDYLHLAKRVMTTACMAHYQWLIVPLEIEAEVVEPESTWFNKKVWAESDGKWSLKG